jgi:recombination protein RecT
LNEVAVAVSTADRQQIVPVSESQQIIRRLIGQNAKAFEAALSGVMPLERFARVVLTVCEKNPELYKCDRGSLLLSCFRVAQLGLSPDPVLGQAWLIPRKGKAEFQLGWKGALQLAYRSPLVAAVRYGVVRQGEDFAWQDGRQWRLKHSPGPEGWPETWDQLQAAWCIIDLLSGGALPRVMYKAEIMRHKARGEGSQPAWTKDLAAMAAKTVIGDACRRAPVDSEIGRAFALDQDGDHGRGQSPGGDEPEIIDVEATTVDSPKTATEAFAQAFGNERKPKAEPVALDLAKIERLAVAKGFAISDVEKAYGRDLLEATANDESEVLKVIEKMGAKR